MISVWPGLTKARLYDTMPYTTSSKRQSDRRFGIASLVRKCSGLGPSVVATARCSTPMADGSSSASMTDFQVSAGSTDAVTQ